MAKRGSAEELVERGNGAKGLAPFVANPTLPLGFIYLSFCSGWRSSRVIKHLSSHYRMWERNPSPRHCHELHLQNELT